MNTAFQTRVAKLATAGLALALVGCVSKPRPNFTNEDYPGVLRAPEALADDVLWRQHVTAVWGPEEERRGFDAVIQKVGTALTVLGLSPTGSVGFAIVLQDGNIELTNQMPEGLPFPPRYVLLDVQRTFYPWLPTTEPVRDGLRQGHVDGEHIVETWSGGRLVERSFTRLDQTPPGTLTVRYRWDEANWSVPTNTVLDNGWFGYKLEIETHEETLLSAGGSP